MSLQVDTEQQKKYPVGIPLVILLAIGFGWWVTVAAQSINQQYDNIGKQLLANQQPLFQAVTLGEGVKPIVLPINDPFRASSRWVYATDAHPLPANYAPASLNEVAVPHTVGKTAFKLQPEASEALTNLFAAAINENTPLIVVSAYRSIAEQQEIYDFRVAVIGKAATEEGTAQPGASEHHTGLAVDINSYTAECETNSRQCGLSPNSARWLAARAPDFGFIVRYPDGKLDQTGIGHEPWHLRYVGKDARSLTASGLTLDEFYKKVTTK